MVETPCPSVSMSMPLVMGILNVTPDSFSDGGQYLKRDDAVARALQMFEEGADVVDVGPESTRPGAEPVSAEIQLARAMPVIHGIRKSLEGHEQWALGNRSYPVMNMAGTQAGHGARRTVWLSIDTRSADVAREALAAGASMVNDVSALRDNPEMASVVAASGASVILMHRRGTSRDMQAGGGPAYENLIKEICDFLCERRRFAEEQGIGRERIFFDPGIGFGKRLEHNFEILRNLTAFVGLGQPVVIGASRKRFIGETLGIEDPASRDSGSLACAVHAALSGAAILRVHNVRETVQAIRILAAIQAGRAVTSPT